MRSETVCGLSIRPEAESRGTNSRNAATHSSNARTSLPQQLAEPRVTGAADRELAAVLQDRHAVLAFVELDARQAIEVEHVGAVNADELCRVQRRLELAERLLFQVLLALAAEADVV